MAALSDYLESGLLHHVFRGETFPKFENVAIALCSGVPQDSDTGSTIPELPSGKALEGGGNTSTGYKRYSLGKPADSGNIKWQYNIDDHNEGSGLIKNNQVFLFDTAQVDWGWVSGLAIVSIIALLLAILFGGFSGLISTLLALGAAWLFLQYLVSRLGGYTGDGLGAMQQVAEITAMISLAAFWGV